MKELSLNILDIAQNSIKANAAHVEIRLTQKGDWLTIQIVDDGKGPAGAQNRHSGTSNLANRALRRRGQIGRPARANKSARSASPGWSCPTM